MTPILPYQQPSDNNKHNDNGHNYDHNSNDNHKEEPGQWGRAQTTPDACRLGYRCVFFIVFLILTYVLLYFQDIIYVLHDWEGVGGWQRWDRAQMTPDTRRLGYRCVFFFFFRCIFNINCIYCISVLYTPPQSPADSSSSHLVTTGVHGVRRSPPDSTSLYAEILLKRKV